MLYNKAGQQVRVAPGAIGHNGFSDAIRRSLREVNEPLPHKGHAFFRLEERAVIK